MSSVSTTDSPEKLYAAREPVFPRRVSGKFRTLKWWIMGVTLGIYYLTPWIRWDRGPDLPNQAVLVDLANRRFFFFMIEIWPHEFYFVAGLLIMAGLGLFLFTSALGRVWCGYACPQTVWTDLFILVERWVEGDRNARVKLWNAKWDVAQVPPPHDQVDDLAPDRASPPAGAWVFYFTDAPTLLRDLVTFNAHPVAYTTIAILTGTTFLFGGFAREQVCIYMCPWPRIQAAMMDEDTHHRRLPRLAGRAARQAPQGGRRRDLGDCIDCNACVNVCPMGIDIRNGQQLACITCALCIDACDDVMDKIGKPRGLIDYIALTDETARTRGRAAAEHLEAHPPPAHDPLHGALVARGIGLTAALFLRQEIGLTVAPGAEPHLRDALGRVDPQHL